MGAGNGKGQLGGGGEDITYGENGKSGFGEGRIDAKAP